MTSYHETKRSASEILFRNRCLRLVKRFGLIGLNWLYFDNFSCESILQDSGVDGRLHRLTLPFLLSLSTNSPCDSRDNRAMLASNQDAGHGVKMISPSSLDCRFAVNLPDHTVFVSHTFKEAKFSKVEISEGCTLSS